MELQATIKLTFTYLFHVHENTIILEPKLWMLPNTYEFKQIKHELFVLSYLSSSFTILLIFLPWKSM